MVPSDNSPITTMAQQIQLAVTGVTGYSPICDSLECCCWTTFFETTFLVCKNIIPTLQETPWIKSVNYLDSLYFGRFGRKIFDIPDIFFSPLPFSFALNKPAHPTPLTGRQKRCRNHTKLAISLISMIFVWYTCDHDWLLNDYFYEPYHSVDQ